ncbi:glycosyltransferase [bacterium AH-315-I18]|nr:glycosyltransferase [bacterium AH-315-I18]
MTTNGIGNSWVANELHQLANHKIPFKLHAMRKPGGHFHASQWAKDMDRDTHVLYPVKPLSVLIAMLIAPFCFGKKFWAALFNALFAKRESLRIRIAGIAHFAVACHWARQLQHQNVSLIHSQWIHSGGTITMYAAWLLGKPFSFTGHAADLFRERCALQDKVDRAAFIVCISQFHKELFMKMGASADKLHIVYCGIDVSLFSPKQKTQAHDVPHILSAGRLVDKKGFEYLIDACGKLRDQQVAFKCTIAGSGPLEDSLKQRVKDQKLEKLVTVTGKSIMQEDIPAFMNEGDIYCLPCVWAKDNDVDGLPQMLMEAMACGVPCISTKLVGIPDLLIQSKTGLLVQPNDASQLAGALNILIHDKQLQEDLASNGVAHVNAVFDLATCLNPLVKQYKQFLSISDKNPQNISRKSTEAKVQS